MIGGIDSAGGTGLRGAVEGIVWPAILPDAGAHLLAVNLQLERSQWWSPDEMRRHQLAQLRLLIAHAAEKVPHYRHALYRRWPRRSDTESWTAFGELPVLSRREIQSAATALFATEIPEQHGGLTEGETSGSIGMPLRYRTTAVAGFFWNAFALREHFWHGRDFAGRHAFIRNRPEDPLGSTWGAPSNQVLTCGEAANLPTSRSISEKRAWLEALNPHYLMTTPSTLRALAESAMSDPFPLERLREVRAVGETVTEALRELVRRAWGVGLVDIYSLSECGLIALQCPVSGLYHVQSEWAVVELIDESGKPSKPGNVGRIVVTPLHNFAMPLLRYDTGDYAEVGDPCLCGRGLPALRRILGRRRNRFVSPDGRMSWPNLSSLPWTRIAPALHRYQLRQRRDHSLLLRYAADRPLTVDEQAAVAEALMKQLACKLLLAFERVDALPLSEAGKLEDFVTEIDQPTGAAS